MIAERPALSQKDKTELTKNPDSNMLKNKMARGEDSCIDILDFKIEPFRIANDTKKKKTKTDKRVQKTAGKPVQLLKYFSI